MSEEFVYVLVAIFAAALVIWIIIGFPCGWMGGRARLDTELCMEGYELVWHGDEVQEWGKGRWEVIDLRDRGLYMEEKHN